jgi:hypothetical protein
VPRFEEFAGDDPLGYVVSLNLKRRHLSETQRAMIAAKIETLKHGGDRKSDQDANLHLDISRDDAARIMKVSPRRVAGAAQVIEHGAPELIAAVEQGDISVSAAAKSLRPAVPSIEPMPGSRRPVDALAKISEGIASLITTGCPKPTATPIKPAAEIRMREAKLIAAPDKEGTKEDIRRPWVSPADKYFKEQAQRLGPNAEAIPKTIGGNLRIDLMAHKATQGAGIPAVLAAFAAAVEVIERHL